jgi:DNA-binding GntR family transcriptional regulator
MPKAQASSASNGDITRGEAAYRQIRHAILKGEFPPAAALSEYQLAAQFQFSRTPVREALTRLEQEGMVRTVTGHGTFVSQLTPHDIMEIYEVREQLECYAARVAAQKMEAEGLSRLEHIILQMHEEAAGGHEKEILDIDLHRTIVKATQNVRMITILATLDDQMHRIRSMWLREPRWQDRTLAEHSAIAKCIAARDPVGAEEAMRKHLRFSCEHAVRFLMPLRND